jgi:hypothetical protein
MGKKQSEASKQIKKDAEQERNRQLVLELLSLQ